jgi:membrane-associated phospholipid phosphatase
VVGWSEEGISNKFLSIYYMFEHIINFIGFHGPEILFITSVSYLYVQNSYTTIYIVGFLINSLINYILKGVFGQPRPIDDTHLFKLEKIYRKLSFEKYGMPSGHTQSMFYSTIYTYLTLKNNMLLFGCLTISLVTIYQRVQSQQHFLLQTIVGAIFGSIIGYVFYKYTR